MAENINISFAPNKSASESQRIADLEQYVSTLTERTKFAFASIIEEYNDTSADNEQTVNMIYQATAESGSDVGQFTNADKNCEIFNDYSENIAQSYFSHAEGSKTSATAPYAHAEGYKTTANAPYAHAEGEGTVASQNAHAEGRNTQATGYASHTEGENTTASGWLSHAEGKNTVANGMYTHAEGENCKAMGDNSHAGGMYSEALSEYSFAHGYGVKSSWTSGTALGRRNKTQNTLFVIGNGDWNEGSESDALTLDENGMLWIEGSFEASAKHSGLGIAIHGAARFGNNWNSDGTNILLAVGNGYDSERKSNALSLDQSGNLHIAGKLTADGGIEGGGSGEYTLPAATKDILGGVMIGNNVSVTADGTISVDISAYLKSVDISDWAKQSDKPTYTANEIGLGNVDNTADADKPISTATQTALDGKADTGHTHTVSDITDMPAYLTQETDPTVPAWAKAKNKPTYIADEVGAAKKKHTHDMSDITDMPEWTKTENKPAYTASEVGAATAADITAAVNAVEIGGRNLLYDSTGNLKKGWNANVTITENGGVSGNSLTISRTGYSGNARYFGVSKRWFLTDFKVGTSYTLSAWIKVRSDVELDASGYVMARFRSADNTKLHILPLTVNNKTKKDEWLYYEKTWTIDDSDIAKLECVALALDKNGMIEACNIKLEKGTKATDWSPAAEEDTERIAALEARVAALEAMAVSGGEV